VESSGIKEARASDKEIGLVKLLRKFPETVRSAAELYSPALIANYCYELAREYNQFYHDYSILGENDISKRNLRLMLSEVTGRIIFEGMFLLGIEMPERM